MASLWAAVVALSTKPAPWKRVPHALAVVVDTAVVVAAVTAAGVVVAVAAVDMAAAAVAVAKVVAVTAAAVVVAVAAVVVVVATVVFVAPTVPALAAVVMAAAAAVAVTNALTGISSHSKRLFGAFFVSTRCIQWVWESADCRGLRARPTNNLSNIALGNKRINLATIPICHGMTR